MATMIEPRQGFGSLDRSLWPAYTLARRMGLSDLGTYNPSSTLPGGGPSDHARSPALAFDAGFFPPVGYAHPQARLFFEAMVGRPEVNYVILGDVIWSRARGRHTYTAGGHMNHVHVSGVPGLVASDRRTPSSTGTLSAGEVASLWINAGGNPRQAQMAAAVALRESGGRPQARALTQREDSRGLWQINVRAHPQWALRDLFNPRVNAKAAVSISRNGTDWSPWTTAAGARADVSSGGVPEVVRPGGQGFPGSGLLGGIGGAAGDVAGGIGGAAGDVLGGVTGIFKPIWAWTEALVAFVTFVVNPLNWLRLAEVLLGFSLILMGLGALIALFTKDSSSSGARGSAIARVASLGNPVGRAGALVRRGAKPRDR